MLELIKRHIVVVIIAAAALVGFFVLNREDRFAETNESDFEQDIEFVNQELANETNETEDRQIIVDVKGEVKAPGVYEMEQNSRLTDVIKHAGGFTKLADESAINLAQKVQDELVIIVPKEGEETSTYSPANQLQTNGEGAEKVHVNNATVAEIETLNGIGPKKAQAIVDYREENGPFQTVDDLIDVSGIGAKTVENLTDSIVIP